MSEEILKKLAMQVRTWGRWGPSDEIGTLNFITPDTIAAACRLATAGKVFALGMPLQCVTQWDSLAHVFYEGKMYNGYDAALVTSSGTSKNSIDKTKSRIAGR